MKALTEAGFDITRQSAMGALDEAAVQLWC